MGCARAVARQAHHGQSFIHRAGFVGRRARVFAQAKAYVLRHGQVREDGVALKHHIGWALVWRHSGHIFAINQHHARRNPLKPRNGAQKRGLAAAGWAQKREELSRLDRGGDAAQGVIVAVIFVHIFKFDHRRFGRCHRKPPLSLAPVRARPRRRKNSAKAKRVMDTPTRIVPKAMILGTFFGKRSCP